MYQNLQEMIPNTFIVGKKNSFIKKYKHNVNVC